MAAEPPLGVPQAPLEIYNINEDLFEFYKFLNHLKNFNNYQRFYIDEKIFVYVYCKTLTIDLMERDVVPRQRRS